MGKVDGKVIVPYLIDSDVPRKNRGYIEWAIERMAAKTCVRLVPRSDQANYATFKGDPDRCSSPVGMATDKDHDIKVGKCSKGATLHEILHTVGVFHEQSRPDRDAYIAINWDNIVSGKRKNFEHCEDCHTQELPY